MSERDLYTETVCAQTPHRTRDLFLRMIPCVILFSLSSQFSLRFPSVPLLTPLAELAALAAAAAVLYRYFRSGAAYRYSLTEKGVRIGILQRGAETVLAQIPWQRIDALTLCSDDPSVSVPRRKKYGVSDTAYLIRFCDENGREDALLFAPSEQFVKKMQQLSLDNGAEM